MGVKKIQIEFEKIKRESGFEFERIKRELGISNQYLSKQSSSSDLRNFRRVGGIST